MSATFASDGEATVPEPADAVALASLAGMGLVGMVWRRRRTAAYLTANCYGLHARHSRPGATPAGGDLPFC